MRTPADELEERYKQAGFGNRIAFGASAAVLTIDLFRAFTDPNGPLYDLSNDIVDAVATVLQVARTSDIPVIHVVSRYGSPAHSPVFLEKNPVLRTLREGGQYLELDPRLGPAPSDEMVVKTGTSAFFNTSLQPLLTGLHVDTLVVTGIVTSGCVRATVVDAVQHGFRPFIPRECVGDPYTESHHVSLVEMNAKYADVVSTDWVVERLTAPRG